MRLLIYIVSIVTLAAGAFGEIGSVISSYWLGFGKPGLCLGVYRDASYVYGVVYNPNVLRRFTPSGSFIDSVPLARIIYPRGADHCHLGGGYLCICDEYRHLHFVNKSTGSTVSSFTAAGAGSGEMANVFWDGVYYYVAGEYSKGRFNRYTASGAYAGLWVATGWPSSMAGTGGAAYSNIANYAAGDYLVASTYYWTPYCPSCIIDIDTGSLVATWDLPPLYPISIRASGAVCGPAYPPKYGAAYWVGCFTMDGTKMFQVDIGGRSSAVTPASVGKVKAIYR